MKFKGTKGNWRVRTGNGLLFVESPKEYLGTPYGQEILADDYFKEDEKIHDFNLVAAAPDLLNACIKMIDYYENGKVSSGISYLEEAINKALGKNKAQPESEQIST